MRERIHHVMLAHAPSFPDTELDLEVGLELDHELPFPQRKAYMYS